MLLIKVIKILFIMMVILVLLPGQSLAKEGDAGGQAGATGSTDTKVPGGVKKSAGGGEGKPTSISAPSVTGTMGSIYTGGWSGLGGGFIGDFGQQYNTYPYGFGLESVNMFGPLGMFGQYGMYGPFGMYGPTGPSFGSSLGFGGFGAHDPWALYKQANIEWAAQAAASAEKPAGQPAEKPPVSERKPAAPSNETPTTGSTAKETTAPLS